jgi:hypothetical protein
MSTLIFRIFREHFIPAVAASAADNQLSLIGRQLRQSVLNQLANLPRDNAASAALEGVNFQTVRTSNTHSVILPLYYYYRHLQGNSLAFLESFQK